MKPLPGGASSFLGRWFVTSGNRRTDNLRRQSTSDCDSRRISVDGHEGPAHRRNAEIGQRIQKLTEAKSLLACSLLQTQALGSLRRWRHVPNVELSRSVFQ